MSTRPAAARSPSRRADLRHRHPARPDGHAWSLHVEARDSSGAVIASGDGSGPILLGARADVSIHLASGPPGDDRRRAPTTGQPAPTWRPPGDMVVDPAGHAHHRQDDAIVRRHRHRQDEHDRQLPRRQRRRYADERRHADAPEAQTSASSRSTPTAAPPSQPGDRCHVTASVAPTYRRHEDGDASRSPPLRAARVGGTLTANALTPGAVKIHAGQRRLRLVARSARRARRPPASPSRTRGSSPTTALTVHTSDAQFVATGCNGMTLDAGAHVHGHREVHAVDCRARRTPR